MSFKYIDPGYGWGVTTPINVYKSNVYNPRNGVAFSLTEEYYKKKRYTSIRGTSESESLTDLWMKFDIFLPETLAGKNATLKISNGEHSLLDIEQSQAETTSSCIVKALNNAALTLNESSGDITNLKKGAVNTVWIHVIAGSSAWNITIAVNGEYIFNDASSSNFAGTTHGIFSFRISSEQPISNLIISDEEIDLNEVITEIGNSGIETTMLENDGTYSSAQAGDYVLQTLDTTNLYNLFGAEGKVLGMVAIAAPAYTTGEDVTQIKCRTDDGEAVTDYRIQDPTSYYESDAHLTQYSEKEFAALENVIPAMGKQLNVTSDTTFASLNGLKVGWVTA